MGNRHGETFHYREEANGKQAHEKMFNITDH